MRSIFSQPIALAWRYATGGWAMLMWQYGAMPSQTVRMAEHVRYGSHLRIPFPFKLVGLPVGWKLSGASYQIERGRIMGNELLLGPSQGPWGRSVVVAPPGYADCVLGSGARSVSFAGASGVLIDGRDVCFPSLRGMFVWVYLNSHMGAAMSLLPHLRVLGLDPARWTAHPLGQSG